MRKNRSLGAALLGVVTALLAGCRAGAPAPAAPNVVLISIDTLRADHLGCYGHPRPTSPAIDALAAQGVLFEQAFSASPWTLPSHASMLTGLLPSRHGILDAHHVLSPELPTLAERLRAAGFRTAAFVNVTYLTERNGLARGFETLRHYDESRMELSAPRAVADATAWIDAHAGEPFFLFFHSFDVHSDYRPGPAYRERFAKPYAGPMDGSTLAMRRVRDGRYEPTQADLEHLRDLYDGAIRQLDDRLAELFAHLERSGLAARTIVVVTSDHGEEFYEHGGLMHGRTLYDEVLRVPLIVRGPGLAAGRRIPALVSLVDLPATLLALAGQAPPAGLDGTDLAPLLHAADAPSPADRVAFAEAAPWKLWKGAQSHLIGVRTPSRKLIRDIVARRTQLFDLAADPAEQHDVAAERAGEVAALDAHVARYLGTAKAQRGEIELTPEQAERLRALGYGN